VASTLLGKLVLASFSKGGSGSVAGLDDCCKKETKTKTITIHGRCSDEKKVKEQW
jgi:hypothetical protein